MKTLKGTLHCEIATLIGGACCSTSWTFEVWGTGELIENVIVPQDIQPEVLIEATFDGLTIVDYTILELLDSTNQRRTHAAFVRVIRPDEEDRYDEFLERTRKSAEYTQSLYRKHNLRRWSEFKVSPYVLISDCGRHLRSTCWQPIRQLADSDCNYWHGIGGPPPNNICGHAFLNGQYAWTYSNGNCSNLDKTKAHEHGHNEGLHHDGRFENDRLIEYGGHDIMANGRNRDDINAPHMYWLGQYVPEEIYIMPKDQGEKQVFLVDPAMDLLSSRDKEYRIILMDQWHNNRWAVGVFRDTIRVYTADGVHWRKPVRHAVLSEGQHFENDYIRVEYIDKKDGCYRVNVKWAKDQTVTPTNKPWPEMIIPDNNEPIVIGQWENPKETFQGFDMWQAPDGTIGCYWYTCEWNQTPRWYTANGTIDENGVANLKLYVNTPTSSNEIGWMKFIQIQSDHENKIYRGKMYYWSEEHGRGCIELQCYYVRDENNKAFAFKGHNHEGMTLNKRYDPDLQVNHYFGFIFTFTQPRPPISTIRHPRWYVISGYEGQPLDILEVSETRFRIEYEDAKVEKIGELIINDDQTEANILNTTYELTRIL